VIYAPGVGNQITIEGFTRRTVFGNIEITPDVQVIYKPALNPDTKWEVVGGLRARVKW